MVTIAKISKEGSSWDGIWHKECRNPEYTQIALSSKEKVWEGGFSRITRRNAFLTIKTSDLSEYHLGEVVPGKIRKVWSYQPFYEGQAPTINPSDGTTALKNGKEYFLRFELTQDMSLPDNQEVTPEVLIEDKTVVEDEGEVF